jgi:hypothetical protein
MFVEEHMGFFAHAHLICSGAVLIVALVLFLRYRPQTMRALGAAGTMPPNKWLWVVGLFIPVAAVWDRRRIYIIIVAVLWIGGALIWGQPLVATVVALAIRARTSPARWVRRISWIPIGAGVLLLVLAFSSYGYYLFDTIRTGQNPLDYAVHSCFQQTRNTRCNEGSLNLII